MDLEVVVEGVSDVRVANEIKRKIQQVCKEMELIRGLERHGFAIRDARPVGPRCAGTVRSSFRLFSVILNASTNCLSWLPTVPRLPAT